MRLQAGARQLQARPLGREARRGAAELACVLLQKQSKQQEAIERNLYLFGIFLHQLG